MTITLDGGSVTISGAASCDMRTSSGLTAAIAASTAARRRSETFAWTLLLALVPMLSFFGHWEIRFDIPGTGYYFSWPTDSSDDHDDPASSHEHAGHCHGEVASCSGSPVTAAAPVALLSRDLVFPVADALLTPLLSAPWRPAGANVVIPDPPPPRLAL